MGSEEPWRTVTIVEFAGVRCASQDVVTGIVRIGAETVPRAQIVQVFGIICIRLAAPFRDLARDFSPLSTCITARIQCTGTLNRLDASVTNAAKGWKVLPLARWSPAMLDPHAQLQDNIGAAKTITAHSIDLRDRKAAIVPAAVKSEALTRRPDGRLSLLIHGTKVRTLAGTEEWSAL